MGPAEEVPAGPADFVLLRFTVDPGAGLPIEADDPALALVYVEAGAVPEPEEDAPGTEFTLEAGDSVVFPPNVAGEIRNDGRGRVVLLAAIVEPLQGGEATPVAGTPTG